MIDGIEDGLKAGATARKSWGGFFAEHFGIYEAGPLESEQIRLALMTVKNSKLSEGHRGEIFAALTSKSGQAFWAAELATSDPSERRFHQWLMQSANGPLVELLTAISAYEQFSRYLQDALDDCLNYLSQNTQRIKISELATLKTVKLAAEMLPKIYPEVVDKLTPVGLDHRFSLSFAEFSEPAGPQAWVERLLAYHVAVQRDKSRAGKMPWFDRFDDGTYLIRPGYVREYRPRHDDGYVHAYRTHSLWSFASDLHLVNSE